MSVSSVVTVMESSELTVREMKAFYLFAFAVEPLTVVVFTALSTVVLQSLAAAAAVDTTTFLPCDYSSQNYTCIVNVAGAWIDPSSFSLYTTAISVFLQAFMFISLGALADHGSLRKTFMISFMLLSCIMCFLMLCVRSADMFLFAATLIILAQLFFGGSFCFYNAYIPVLANVHWDVLQASPDKRDLILEDTMNTLSAVSQINGYLGSVACFALVGATVFSLQLLDKSTGFGVAGFFDTAGISTYAMEVGIAVAGLWALLGLYWPFRYIKDRPYPKLPKGTNYILYSWKKVFCTIRYARKLPNTFIFLLGWFLLSDALTTVGTTTILFAKDTLGFGVTEILALAIAAPLTAGGGSYLWLLVQRYTKWSTRIMLIIVMSISIFLPVYGIMGFFLPFGLVNKWELYPVGILYGVLLGGVQSFARVLFSEIIPRGRESEFFALYAITDKGSSWFGPLIVGAITDATHEIRYGFVFLLVILSLPVICIWYVDVEKGKIDAALASNTFLESIELGKEEDKDISSDIEMVVYDGTYYK